MRFTSCCEEGLGTDLDHVAGLHLEAGDVNGAAIHEDVAVVDGLTGGLAAVAEASAVNHVVETALEELEKDHTGDATAAGSFFVVTAELLFEHTVLETKLLLFAEGDGVFTLLFTTGTDAVLAGWEVAAFKCLGRAKEGDTEAAADLCAWTCITCHIRISKKVGLDAAGLFRAATVVRNRRHVADGKDFQTKTLDGTHGGLTAGAWTLDADIDFLETVSHGLAAGVLRNHLSGVGGAFPRTLEAHLAGAGPTNGIAIRIRHADEGVVESRGHMDDAAGDILRAFGFVNLDFFLASADFGEDVALDVLFRRSPRGRPLQEQEWWRVLELLRAQPPEFRRNFGWFLQT